MRLSLAALAVTLAAPVMLAGCSLPSWNDLFAFSDDRAAAATPQPVAAPAPAVAAAAAPGAPDPFCASAAQQDAVTDGFDTATQQRMLQQRYQQCVTLLRGP
jgi:hypothetical protein